MTRRDGSVAKTGGEALASAWVGTLLMDGKPLQSWVEALFGKVFYCDPIA